MNQLFRKLLRSVGSWAFTTLRGFVGANWCDRALGRIDQLLIGAGSPWALTGIEVLGIQTLCGVFLPILFGGTLYGTELFGFLFEGPKQVFVYLGLLGIGVAFPVFNLRERARERQRLVALQLPDTLDLLTISVEAGLDFLSALRRVVAKHRPGPLKVELERFFQQVEFGRPRRDALRELASRVQVSDMNAVVAALIQADRLGASIGPVLRAQSDMLRTRRSQRAEKAAQEAPVKMLAPLMACILPAVFIVILGPVIIQMIRDATSP
jgi:tight adherence protein C